MIAINLAATGDNIKRLCWENNVSASALADACGVERQTVSKWRTGRALPSIDHLVEIADTLGVTVDDLLVTERRADAWKN